MASRIAALSLAVTDTNSGDLFDVWSDGAEPCGHAQGVAAPVVFADGDRILTDLTWRVRQPYCELKEHALLKGKGLVVPGGRAVQDDDTPTSLDLCWSIAGNSKPATVRVVWRPQPRKPSDSILHSCSVSSRTECAGSNKRARADTEASVCSVDSSTSTETDTTTP